MKKRWKIIAGILCITLMGTACSKKTINDGEECRFSGEIYVLNVAGEILTLDASHCHALDNVLGKEQVYDDNREDRECNRYIHLTHIKLQEVCGTQLSDQDR